MAEELPSTQLPVQLLFTNNGQTRMEIVSPDNPLPVTGGTAGNVTTLTPTDHSGTITLGGTAQIAIPANADREAFFIANPTGTGERLQVKFGAGGGYFDLLPGAAYETGPTCWLGDIYVNAATTAHPFTATEGE